MNILTRKITRDGETLGYEVNMGKEPQYICSSGLLSRELFQALMANGYSYFGRMEFEDSSGNSISCLPDLPYDSLEDYILADFFEVADVMPESELKGFTKKHERGLSYNWRAPERYLINTREELIEHIKTFIVFNAEDPRTYMPLNSYTNPDALFTEEEFNDPANYWVMDVIANRRYYNLHSLFMMSESLPVSGFGPIDFIDAYYAWGIDGLKSTILSKTIFEIEKPLYVHDNFPKPYTNLGLVYVKKDMTMTPALQPGWTTLNKEEQIYKTASELPSFSHGFLVVTKSPTTSKCIRYEFERMTVEITPDAMKFTTQTGEFLVKTLRFLTPSKQYLPSKLWNLTLDENKDEVLHMLKIESMAKHLSGLLQCKSDVTSMKVYQTIGLTKPRAVDTVLNIYRDILFTRDGNLKDEHKKFLNGDGAFDENEISALSMQIGMVKSLYTYDDGVPENLESLHILCKKVEQGEINIDNVLNGIKADNTVRLEDIIRHLDAAVKILGLGYEEIFEIIERDAQIVSGEGAVTITFEGNGIVNDLMLHRQNFAALGFQKDMRATRSTLAKGAQNWLYVREIYSEPGQACARHIAVRLFSWPHYQAEKKDTFVYAIEDYIKKQVKSQLDNLRIDIGDDIYQLIARCVCEFGLLGKTQASLTVKEGSAVNVAVPPDVCERIKQTFERRYETTFNISNYMFKGTEPIFFCVNAVITPYWVVPLGKQYIPVYPLYLAWHYGKEENARKAYEDIKAQGYIPRESNNYSFKYLQTSFSEETQLLSSTEPGLSLADYCNEYFTDAKSQNQKPLHPMDKHFSALSCADDDYLARDDFSDGLKHKMLYYAALGYSDPQQNIIDVCTLDYTGELIDLYMGGKNRFIEDSAITIFQGFLNKDLFSFSDLDAFKEIYCAVMGNIYVKSFSQNTLLFTDGVEYDHFDIPSLDTSQYAVRKINEQLYLAYYESGQVLRIDL